MMNLWGCRVAFADVERSLLDAGMTAPVMQLRLRNEMSSSGYEEKLIVCLEQPDVPFAFFDKFIQKLLQYCKDVALAVDPSTLRRRVRVECVEAHSIPRIARTGKVKLIIDERDVTKT
jgi:hypothetical protein